MSKISTLKGILKEYKNPISIIIRHILKKKNYELIEARDGTIYFIRENSRDLNVLNEIRLEKVYHKMLTKINNVKNVVDIGANIGAFSIFCAKNFEDAKIYAYEPFPESSRIAKINFLANNIQHRIFIEEIAVSNSDGVRKLGIYKGQYEANSLQNIWGKPDVVVNVKTTTLSKIIKKNKISQIDLLKVDAEGSEYEILESINPEIFKKINNIIIEYHRGKGTWINNKLKDNGFKVYCQESSINSGIVFGFKQKI